MPSAERALRGLTSAAPVPTSGRALVEYMGGTAQAARILSGMDGPPPPAMKRADPERYEADRKAWRAASRQAQRWAKGERGASRPQLDPRQRRAAQAVNRSRRRAEARVGITATLTGRIVIVSGRSGRRDSRQRTIHRVEVADPSAIMDALAEGDTDLAAELLMEGFLEGAGMPAETEAFGASWELTPEGEA